MRLKGSLLLFALTVFLFSACEKDEDCDKGGLGGNVTVILSPEHHGDPIAGGTVFVRFNKSEFPGPDPLLYDLTRPALDSSDTDITISGLKCGDYYFYSKGYDPNIFDDVAGGFPLTIAQKEGTISIIIPVTEE